jgi:cystathionine beta-lyase
VRYGVPQGTYLAWLDCRPLDLPADPAEIFLDRGKVALVSGPVFGTGGEGHVRLNFATSPGVLEEAVRRMASAL